MLQFTDYLNLDLKITHTPGLLGEDNCNKCIKCCGRKNKGTVGGQMAASNPVLDRGTSRKAPWRRLYLL